MGALVDGEGARGAYIVACLSKLIIDHASLTRGGRGGGVLICCCPQVIWPLTTHPFRDGAPIQLLIETPPTFGRSVRLFPILHRNCLLITSPSCFAVCGHHLSPRMAIVFSLLSSIPNSSMSHTSNSSTPPLTHPVPPCVFHILLLCESYSLLSCHTGTYV